MDLEVFAICDAATGSNGKLNILGVFNTIFTKDLPAVHPLCAVVVRLRLNRSEEGEHKLSIDLLDDLGTPLIPALVGSFTVKLEKDQIFGIANLIFNIQNLKINRYGEHTVKLVVDSNPIASLPLLVKRPPK